MKKSVIIGLGSNIGDKGGNLKEAIERIATFRGTTIEKVSSFYKTDPVGYLEQDWFVNAVVKVLTNMAPPEMLHALLEIESVLGRVRDKRWGPRIIDIDILFFGNEIITQNHLIIPHRQLHRRKFVLKPLKEIAPGFIHPVFKKSVLDLYEELESDEKVIKIEE